MRGVLDLVFVLVVILVSSLSCDAQLDKLLMAMVDGETKSLNYIEHHIKQGVPHPLNVNKTILMIDITEEMNFLYTSTDADAHIDPYDQGQTLLANATYLHLAALRGFGKVAEKLISLGAPVNVADTLIQGRLSVQSVTPIHLVAIFGPSNASIVDVLHAHGADLSAETKKGHITPIMFAIELGHQAIFERLLSLMDIEAYIDGQRPRNVSDPVTLASEKVDGVEKPIIQQLKYEDVIPIKQARREATHHWLHLAALHGRIEMAQALLDHPVLRLNPDERAFGGRGDNALAAACSSGQLGMIRFLVKRYGGEGLVSPSSDGVTPWTLAKRSGKLSVTRWLRDWAARNGFDLEATRPNPFRQPGDTNNNNNNNNKNNKVPPLTDEQIEELKRQANGEGGSTVTLITDHRRNKKTTQTNTQTIMDAATETVPHPSDEVVKDEL